MCCSHWYPLHSVLTVGGVLSVEVLFFVELAVVLVAEGLVVSAVALADSAFGKVVSTFGAEWIVAESLSVLSHPGRSRILLVEDGRHFFVEVAVVEKQVLLVA